MDAPYRTIDVMPLSGALGAEIEGVDIASGLGEEQFAEIYRAFADYSVILFRNQPITQEQHIAFARHWGDININRFFTGVVENPIIAEVRKEPDQETNIGRKWHTDHSYDAIPRTRLDSLRTRSSRSGWRYDVFQYVQGLRNPLAGFATNARKLKCSALQPTCFWGKAR